MTPLELARRLFAYLHEMKETGKALLSSEGPFRVWWRPRLFRVADIDLPSRLVLIANLALIALASIVIIYSALLGNVLPGGTEETINGEARYSRLVLIGTLLALAVSAASAVLASRKTRWPTVGVGAAGVLAGYYLLSNHYEVSQLGPVRSQLPIFFGIFSVGTGAIVPFLRGRIQNEYLAGLAAAPFLAILVVYAGIGPPTPQFVEMVAEAARSYPGAVSPTLTPTSVIGHGTYVLVSNLTLPLLAVFLWQVFEGLQAARDLGRGASSRQSLVIVLLVFALLKLLWASLGYAANLPGWLGAGAWRASRDDGWSWILAAVATGLAVLWLSRQPRDVKPLARLCVVLLALVASPLVIYETLSIISWLWTESPDSFEMYFVLGGALTIGVGTGLLLGVRKHPPRHVLSLAATFAIILLLVPEGSGTPTSVVRKAAIAINLQRWQEQLIAEWLYVLPSVLIVGAVLIGGSLLFFRKWRGQGIFLVISALVIFPNLIVQFALDLSRQERLPIDLRLGVLYAVRPFLGQLSPVSVDLLVTATVCGIFLLALKSRRLSKPLTRIAVVALVMSSLIAHSSTFIGNEVLRSRLQIALLAFPAFYTFLFDAEWLNKEPPPREPRVLSFSGVASLCLWLTAFALQIGRLQLITVEAEYLRSLIVFPLLLLLLQEEHSKALTRYGD
jgi:hypothetical protein